MFLELLGSNMVEKWNRAVFKILLDNLFQSINLFWLHANSNLVWAMDFIHDASLLEVCLCLSNNLSDYLLPLVRKRLILCVTVELLRESIAQYVL